MLPKTQKLVVYLDCLDWKNRFDNESVGMKILTLLVLREKYKAFYGNLKTYFKEEFIMKWYNKPITWKDYGILVLISYAVMIVGTIVYLGVYMPEWISAPFEKVGRWFKRTTKKFYRMK